MDKLLYRPLLILFWVLQLFVWQGQGYAQDDASKIATALEQGGIDKQSAQLLGAEIGAIALLYRQLSDSTIQYTALLQYQQRYQTISSILSAKKIKPELLINSWPAAKEMLASATMRVVKRRIAETEASDESAKYKKAFLALENEMLKTELAAKSRNYEAMSGEYLKKIDSWRKRYTEYESFFLDLQLTVNKLNDMHKMLQNDVGAEKLQPSEEFRASVKRLRNIDFHHDNEFIQKFKLSSLVEKTIETGEFICNNIK
ncbi:hypothetical protein [Rhodoflexus sp.]